MRCDDADGPRGLALFDDAQALEAAVFALETHGFDRAAFSLLAEKAAIRKLGHRYRRVAHEISV